MALAHTRSSTSTGCVCVQGRRTTGCIQVRVDHAQEVTHAIITTRPVKLGIAPISVSQRLMLGSISCKIISSATRHVYCPPCEAVTVLPHLVEGLSEIREVHYSTTGAPAVAAAATEGTAATAAEDLAASILSTTVFATAT